MVFDKHYIDNWYLLKSISVINFLYLKNETKTEEIPLQGWKVSREAFQMKNKEWSDDATIKIKKGSLASASEKIKFNRKDRSDDDQLGEFRITGKWFYGHPVYKNSRGVYLFCGFYGWTLNEERVNQRNSFSSLSCLD